MNLLYGKELLGRWILAGKTGGAANGVKPGQTLEFYPGQYTVTAYAPDGTKTAVFGNGSEANALAKVTFEITSTGCGQCELTFRKLPTNTELEYMQRIDISLFGDRKPWYSGYIMSRPIEGTTDTEFKYKGYGYYNRLENILVFKTYADVDVGEIARDIARMAESATGLVYNASKIQDVGYKPTKLVFDGVTAKDAFKTLQDFATGYVYGVDEYRSIYFKRRDSGINEQARLTVGKHINSYSPSWDASKIVNWARVKGGNIDNNGEQWLCTVQDAASQKKFGLRQAVWSLPEAFDVADATRWGQNQIDFYKSPQKSAKITGVKLEYPYPDGTFNVRHMSTDGLAEIRRLDGKTETYPIKKIKYTISGSTGIRADLELGEPEFTLNSYLAGVQRRAKDLEQSQSAALKQLKGGS